MPADEPLAVDTETTGLGRWTGDHIMGLCLGGATWQAYVPIGHPGDGNWAGEDVAAVLAAVAGHGGQYLMHHSKFDWCWLERLAPEIDWQRRTWDTMSASWLENENRYSHRLKDLGAAFFDYDAKAEQKALDRIMAGPGIGDLTDEYYYGPGGKAGAMLDPGGYPDGTAKPKYKRQPMGVTREQARKMALADPRFRGDQGKRGWGDLLAHELAPYGAMDGRLTWDLWQYQQERIDAGRVDIARAMPREMRWQTALYRMEGAGIRVDEERAMASRIEAVSRAEQLAGAFEKHQGVDLGSNDQVREMIYGAWEHRPRYVSEKTGRASVSKEALEELLWDERVGLILEWRQLTRSMSHYYDPLLRGLDTDGRVHPTFNNGEGGGSGRGSTRTGRLSCSQPNLMTIPRVTNALAAIRGVFIPAPGMELWEYDLANAELRWAGALSRDPRMLAAFAEKRDLYQDAADALLCSAVCAKDAKGRCPIHRQDMKTIVLAFQYGAGVPKLAAQLAAFERQRIGRRVLPNLGRTYELVNGFRWRYGRLIDTIARYEQFAVNEGQIPLHPPGRYRHFRGAGYIEEPRKAFNSACQGGVGELAKDVQMEATPELDRLGARICLQVHDSWVVEVAPGTGAEVGLVLQDVVDQVNPYPWVRQLVESKVWS